MLHSSRVCHPDLVSSAPSSVSPIATGPTPAGVPVKIRSPICNLKNLDTYTIISSKEKIISRVLPSCTSDQFFCKRNWIPVGSTLSSPTKGLSAAEPSKPFAISQGCPFFLHLACRSRAVKSMPRPTCW